MTYDPAMSQRDPSKTYYQLRPKSLRSSGAELDDECVTSGSPSGMDELHAEEPPKADEQATMKRGSR